MAAAEKQGLSPGFKFEPSDEVLVEFFLLPYLRDGELPLAGLVFVDDPRSLPPWMLLDRHERGDEDEAYFVGPAAAEGRQVRSVAGGGRWVKQRTEAKGKVLLGGETFRWEKFSLNFHRDDRRSGSTGWVMHEYVVVPPPGSAIAASHRVSHIAFTGHGQNRKRVPDGYVVVVDGVQSTTSAAAPPPSHEASNQGYYADTQQDHQHLLPATVEQSNQHQEYAYTEQNQHCFVPEQQSNQQHYFPEAEQSNQQFFPAVEQSNQQFLPALEQSNQEYAYGEKNQCYIVPEQQSNQQDFACYEQHQQQHQLFHGDLTSWEEPLATSQQFHGPELLLPDGLLDGVNEGGVPISPEDGVGALLNDIEMQELIAELMANPDGSEGGSAYYDQPQC